MYIIDSVTIDRNKENDCLLRIIRKGIEGIIEAYDGYLPSFEKKVEDIIAEYIKRIAKGYPTYMVNGFSIDENIDKKLTQALAKYALKVRKDDAIAFIDTTVWNSGKAGILFAKDGIAFDYAFEKIFAKYEEITGMSFNKKGNELIFHGDFAERKDNSMKPSITDTYFNLSELKECIEEIRYCI